VNRRDVFIQLALTVSMLAHAHGSDCEQATAGAKPRGSESWCQDQTDRLSSSHQYILIIQGCSCSLYLWIAQNQAALRPAQALCCSRLSRAGSATSPSNDILRAQPASAEPSGLAEPGAKIAYPLSRYYRRASRVTFRGHRRDPTSVTEALDRTLASPS